MNDKTQPSRREDGFGTKGVGEGGDGNMGLTQSSQGGTGAVGGGGAQRGGRKVEGATGQEHAGAHGRRSPANKQGVEGQQD
ncbi:MAG TPA: hypothetical protein VE650_08060 [Acetobacteraceae bacterium]|nr:hypothetical protein [Acetobacteraceae bacterium]